MTTDNSNVFSRPEPLQLPEAFQQHLLSFRQRVWIIKTVEAVSGAMVGVVLAYLLVFILDRFIDTPMWGRLAILAVAACALATIPVLLHRWIWCHRRMEQLARLISRQYPSLGDSMLGIIELVRSDGEASRSRALCKAAIAQVSSEALERDFSGAVPTPRHRQWLTTAAVALAITAAVGLSVPRAAMNASLRFFFPWSNVDRYTFADLKPLPAEVVVPHGEPATILVSLNPDSQWKPAAGKLTIGQQLPLKAPLAGDKYEFEIPGQITKAGLDVSVGDAQQRIAIAPDRKSVV